MENETILELSDVTYKYGSIVALNNINIKINAGEIHAIVGEHGAGKSTLASIVANLNKPSSGQVLFNGQPYSKLSYKDTIDAGIRMVFQKIQLNECFTVAENLFVANKALFQTPGRFFSKKKVLHLAETFLEEHGFDLKASSRVSELGLSDRAFLSIVRNLYTPPALLILDEALEKLSAASLESVINTLKSLKKQGKSVLFVTHRIDDLYMIADRVSVIRKGEVLISEDIQELDKISLIKMAYTQFSRLDKEHKQIEEFNRLLKYNEVVLKQLPISLVVSDHNDSIHLINESAKTFFRIEEQEGLTIDSLFSRNPQALGIIYETLADKKMAYRYNIPLYLDSRKVVVNILVYPVHDENIHIGNMLIIEDTTEREQLREQLVLSEKLASVGLLAAGVAHEINNPLGVISNYLESFRQGKIKHEQHDNVIHHLFDQIDYISKVIGNLIAFSENRKQTTEIIDVEDEISNIIDLVKYNGANRNINIALKRSEDQFLIEMNQNEFKQVLLNLFKNSFEAMPGGGKIVIDLSALVKNNGKHLCLSFTDTGPGIQVEDPNDIFLPFKSTKAATGHFGLGLSLCYNILTRYNGKISVTSLENEGCSFRITMPLANQ